MNAGVADRVRAAGGAIYAISSEPQSLANRAQEAWGLDFETLGDPHHEIVKQCRANDWLDLLVNERLGFLQASLGEGLDWEPTHPKGYLQPGVLALRGDGRVLYRWRGVPTRSNMGGAMGRPTPEHVWSSIEAVLGAPVRDRDAELDKAPPVDGKGVPWPIFVSLLLANGWFLRGRGFDSVQQLRRAPLKLAGFIALWTAAFLWLPLILTGTALALWVAYIIPKVRWLGEEFQDVTGDPQPAAARRSDRET